MSTIKDVALHAKVSTATVSRVLNHDSRVKEKTAKKVKESIEALNYRMNHVARSLKTSKSQIIGILAPEFKNDFFMSIVTGVEKKLKQKGFSVILCSSRESVQEEKKEILLLKDKNIDGLIMIPGSSEGIHIKESIDFPIVLVDRLVKNLNCDAVLSDNMEGTEKAINICLDRGEKRVAFIGGKPGLTSSDERFKAYQRALKKRGLRAQKQDIHFGDYHSESGYKIMKSLMEQKNPPKTIFISNYFMHIGAAKYLLENKRRKELNIVSFDDMPLASFFPFSSITIAQPMDEIGEMAASLLLKRIEGDQSPFKTLRLKTSLRSTLLI